MSKAKQTQKAIQVYAHWQGLSEAVLAGTLYVAVSKGKEIFSFEYDALWLKSPHSQMLDPSLTLFVGPQYVRDDHVNFGVFMDSSPDRWGRHLMKRREAQLAKQEEREAKVLLESDYLLGVYDGNRMGALRFCLSSDGPFLNDNKDMASPPLARLRDLEYASLQLEKDGAEKDKDYMNWLKLLIAPGGSLGGARPKSSVVDEKGMQWIAKFPSQADENNMGAWEYLVHQLARGAGVETSEAKIQKFSSDYDTFMTKRFDRTDSGERIHFASAMTLLGRKDGDNAATGASYLELADFIIRNGSQVTKDLEQLWRRIVFNICVSNTDDHLRNHGFLLKEKGWILSPAYDMNPSSTGSGLTLNISDDDNEQSIALAMSVIPYFRVKKDRAEEIVSEITGSVKKWPQLAKRLSIKSLEMEMMRGAFRIGAV